MTTEYREISRLRSKSPTRALCPHSIPGFRRGNLRPPCTGHVGAGGPSTPQPPTKQRQNTERFLDYARNPPTEALHPHSISGFRRGNLRPPCTGPVGAGGPSIPSPPTHKKARMPVFSPTDILASFSPNNQNRPTTSPFSSISMASAAGTFGRPGIAMISPVNATTNPAPADRRT